MVLKLCRTSTEYLSFLGLLKHKAMCSGTARIATSPLITFNSMFPSLLPLNLQYRFCCCSEFPILKLWLSVCAFILTSLPGGRGVDETLLFIVPSFFLKVSPLGLQSAFVGLLQCFTSLSLLSNPLDFHFHRLLENEPHGEHHFCIGS